MGTRIAHSFILVLLLIVFPTTSLYPHVRIDVSRIHDDLTLEKFTENLSYDQLLQLVEVVESGKIDKYSKLEQAKIAHFIAYLAEKGSLPTEDHSRLEDDTHELLEGQQNIYNGSSFHKYDGKIICLSGTSSKDLLSSYQANWFSKRLRHIKKFIKKHKKEIIIGAAVVVASAIVLITVTKTLAAKAASAALAAEEKIAKAKEAARDAGLLEEPVKEEALPLAESARVLGSLFAHEALDQLSDLPEWAHLDIDQSFDMNYAHLSNFESTDFTTLSYQMRGEHALYCGYFEQAVEDFGRVITLNPDYSLAYLDRGMAHFELGNYQNSLDDYHEFIKHKESLPFSIPEFTLGFAKGLPKGMCDSCDGTLLFISDLVTHPINTSMQVYSSLNELKNMISAKEWGLLCDVLTPEIYQLATEWDTLSSHVRGELAGYALGKHGTDILLPGAATKLASSGLKCSKELCALIKSFQTSEQILQLEAAAALGNGTTIGVTVQQAKSVLLLGEEVGLTTQELGQLKQAGTLEQAVAQKTKYIFDDPALKASYEFYKKAQAELKPFNKGALPEARVRELIHQTGVKTFERPKGIPETYSVKITDKGAGMEYYHSNIEGTSIRVMPGKPHSPLPYQQKPYVILTKQGKVYDKFGNVVSNKDPMAHIPIDEFIYVQ